MADEKPLALQYCRQIIEEKGTARQHGDTLEKRGISVDDLLNPSRENHSKKIKYFNRVSFCLGLRLGRLECFAK